MDAIYLLHLRCPQVIFLHETALFPHDLTDRRSLAYSITSKTGYNPIRLKSKSIQVFTIKSELQKVGLTITQIPFEFDMLIYNNERTICDIISSRSVLKSRFLGSTESIC